MTYKTKLCIQLPVPDEELGPFANLLDVVKNLGYIGVETCVKDPWTFDRAEFIDMIHSRGMVVPAVATGRGKRLDGLCLLDRYAEIAEKAVQRLKDQTDLLVELGGKKLILGSMKGMAAEGESQEEAGARLAPFLQRVADYAASKDCEIVLEAMNRFETNMANTAAEACVIAKMADRSNVRVLLDTFHMNIEDTSIAGSIIETGDMLGHMHVVDSNRCGCGAGHIDFAAVLAAIYEIGYDEFVTLEQFSDPDVPRAASMTVKHLTELGMEIVPA
ncbi:TIM barrel protein [Candidatus Hydrogenedentota bacterium]